MAKNNALEVLVGAVVLVIAGGFLSFAYKNVGMSSSGGYPLTARFESIDGIQVGSDVRVGGIKVGAVTAQALEPETYMAKLSLSLNSEVKIPADTVAQIVSDGLLGGKYIALVPGSEEEMLKANEEIAYTQSSINLEALIGKFMFSGGGDDAGAAE